MMTAKKERERAEGRTWRVVRIAAAKRVSWWQSVEDLCTTWHEVQVDK